MRIKSVPEFVIPFALLALLAAALLLPSCNDDKNKEGEYHVDTVEEFLTEGIRILCDHDSSFYHGYTEIFYESNSQCVEYWKKTGSFDQSLINYNNAIDDGRMGFDKRSASRALKWYDENQLFGSLDMAARYHGVFVGKVDLEDDCIIPQECKGDTFCYREQESDCSGVCKATHALGEHCEDNSSCSTEKYKLVVCTPFSGCLGIPETLATEGEICGTGDNSSYTSCAPGLICKQDSEPDSLEVISGTCTKKRQIGESCEIGDRCEEGSICLVDNEIATCTEVAVEREAGKGCYLEGAEDKFTFCGHFQNLSCVEGQCVRLGDGSDGSACVELGCKEGNFCDDAGEDTSTCITLKSEGEICGRSWECESNWCNPGTSKCEEFYCQ